jgi:ribose transport system ATP-binding protein
MFTLQMKEISKAFAGVQALDRVSLQVSSGEVLALLGENGAGKSTLMKILCGAYDKTSGTILYEGKPLEIRNPRDAQKSGISIIHQELNLIPTLTIAENIFLGREPLTRTGRIDSKRMNREAGSLLAKLNVDLSPRRPVAGLSIGLQQMVEIAKVLSLESKVIIMDEPTGSLTETEAERLFSIIADLRSAGKAIIYISHRLAEIFRICDRVMLLRDGKYVGESLIGDIDENRLIEMMVGRRLEEQCPRVETGIGTESRRVEGLGNAIVHDVSFSVAQGEILGVTGLMGAGRTELALTIYGALPALAGQIFLDGKKIEIRAPHEAISHGISYVSEDRKQQGLILGLPVGENITLPALRQFQRLFFHLDPKAQNKVIKGYIDDLSIKTSGAFQVASNLSGGNQQKVSIAKGLISNPVVLILDEPTRGVDVGAKKEIYELINLFKKKGLAIIMISSELPEILGMSDRIMVMHEGTVRGIVPREGATQETIMRLAIATKGIPA